MFRYLWIIWAALLASSVLLCITYHVYYGVIGEGTSLTYLGLRAIPTVVFWLLLTAEVLITCILVIARFYQGLLGDEGYLMHTLPVKKWQLITSKGIVATVACIISIIVAAIAVALMASFGYGATFSDLSNAFREFSQDVDRNIVPFLMEMLIMAVAAIVCQIYKAYAAMSIGQLAGKHRILSAAGAYIGINIILSVISTVALTIFNATGIEKAYWSIDYPGQYARDHLLVLLVLIVLGVEIAAYHIIAERLQSRKLNLL